MAYRVIAAGQAPDHATIARFRQRHEVALAELFGEVLTLCAKAGIAQPTVLAVDSTKLHANASGDATRTYEQLAKEILEAADQVDADEDARFGERRGDELPPELVSGEGRRAWLREAKRQLDEQRAKEAEPIPKSRPERVKEAKRRLEEDSSASSALTTGTVMKRPGTVMKTSGSGDCQGRLKSGPLTSVTAHCVVARTGIRLP